jgi:hypothetical protein
MMSLNDGAADREPHTHAVALCGVKGVKHFVHALAVNAEAGISHREAYGVAVVMVGSDQQLTRAVVYVGHRIRRVPQQVQHHLLDLNAVARDRWEIVGEFRLDDNAVPLKVAH